MVCNVKHQRREAMIAASVERQKMKQTQLDLGILPLS